MNFNIKNLRFSERAEDKDNIQKPPPSYLKIIAIVLAILIGLFSVFIIVKVVRGESNFWSKIFPWTKNLSDKNGLTSDGGGVSGLITLDLNNNVSVTLPAEMFIYTGYKEKLNLTFKNNSKTSQLVNLKFSGLPFTYLEDKTPNYDNQNQIIDLFTVSLDAGESKDIELIVQTLKVWDNYFTLYINEKSQRVYLDVEVKDKTPIFGNDHSACADNQPFITYFGPDCGEGNCDGLSIDKECIKAAKRSGSNSCWPYQFEYYPDKEDDILDACQKSLMFNTQIARNTPIHWGIMVEEDRYAWEKPDWYIETVSSKINAQQGLPSGIMNGDAGWARTCSKCTNPDDSTGFFDINNDYLSGKFRQFVYDLSARYGDKITYYEMANEPAASFYLCACGLTTVPSFKFIPENTPLCNADAGPNQQACAGGNHVYEQTFADTYGDFLAGSVKIASEELIKNNPKAFIITGAIDDQNRGLAPVTEYMIKQGILDNGNVAIGIHQYPHNGLSQLWSDQFVNCSYYQKPNDPWWLPEECEKAPPFSDYSNEIKGKNFTMGEIWAEMDSRYDASEILKDIQTLGVLDKTYFFDSELHAGYSNPKSKYDLTEAIAGFRIGVINAHQKYLGTIYVLIKNNDFSASVYNLMVKTLSGTTPVYKWESKLIDSDYSGVVYKLFTRGNEDILIFWNNDNGVRNVTLETKKFFIEAADRQEMIRLDAENGVTNFIENKSYADSFTIKPVKEIIILSVLRKGGSPFDWLTGISY